jgi:hypothetical protein
VKSSVFGKNTKKTPEDFFRGLVHRLYVTAQQRCGSDHHGRLVCQPSRRFAAAHRFASRSVKNVMSSIIDLPFVAQEDAPRWRGL